MGSVISTQNGKNENNTKKAPNPFNQPGKLSWFRAGESTSNTLMSYAGSDWCNSSRDGGIRSDTYQNVTEKMGRSMLKEKLQQIWQKNSHQNGRGTISFYGYSFHDGRQTIAAGTTLNLADQREILGIANLQGPLSWFPIGKNRIDAPDEDGSVCAVFAQPEHVIIRLTVDNIEVGDTRCPGSGPPCFLCLSIKDYDDLTQLKKFPIYLTHVDRMNISQPEPYTSSCAESFNEVLRSLRPGMHHCQMTLQFTYKTSKVTTVSLKQRQDPLSSPRAKKNCDPMGEVFDFATKQTVRNSSLVLRHSNPSKYIVSPALCSGQFNIVLPENYAFDNFEYGNFLGNSLGSSGYQQDKDSQLTKKKIKHKSKRRRFSSG